MVLCSLVAGAAHAQLDAPPEPPLPPPPAPSEVAPPPELRPPAPAPPPPAFVTPPPTATGKYESHVRAHRPSPSWTQDRSFTSTRFWLMDPGNYEAQLWLRTRVFRGAPTELLMQAEVEVGLTPHLQLDLYENVTFNVDGSGRRGIQQEGNQIELRIAFPSYYGQVFANPVLYLEWHPRQGAPDRAEVRLLLGGAPAHWMYLAVNPYIETNVEPTATPIAVPGPGFAATVVSPSTFIADMEFGTTVAAGFKITDWFRLSAELKIGADMLGDPGNRLHFVWFAGPGFILKPLKNKYLKIMATCLFAIPPTDAAAQQFEPLLIVGSQF